MSGSESEDPPFMRHPHRQSFSSVMNNNSFFLFYTLTEDWFLPEGASYSETFLGFFFFWLCHPQTGTWSVYGLLHGCPLFSMLIELAPDPPCLLWWSFTSAVLKPNILPGTLKLLLLQTSQNNPYNQPAFSFWQRPFKTLCSEILRRWLDTGVIYLPVYACVCPPPVHIRDLLLWCCS